MIFSNLTINEGHTVYGIHHKQFCTDRYEYGTTLVAAKSKQEAMNKLNDYLATKPDGHYTAMPCESIEDVHHTKILCDG